MLQWQHLAARWPWTGSHILLFLYDCIKDALDQFFIQHPTLLRARLEDSV